MEGKTVHVVTVGTSPSDSYIEGIYATEESAIKAQEAENTRMRKLWNYPATFNFATVDPYEVKP